MSAERLDTASMEDFRNMAAALVRVEALADEWDRRPGVGDYITLTEAVDDLRAALRASA